MSYYTHRKWCSVYVHSWNCWQAKTFTCRTGAAGGKQKYSLFSSHKRRQTFWADTSDSQANIHWRYSSLVAFHLDQSQSSIQLPSSNEEPWPENMRHKSLRFDFWILKINPFGHLWDYATLIVWLSGLKGLKDFHGQFFDPFILFLLKNLKVTDLNIFFMDIFTPQKSWTKNKTILPFFLFCYK